MMHARSLAVALGVALLSAVGCSAAVVADPTHAAQVAVQTQFVSSKLDAGLRFVENSGVCETTPGVHTVSGYIDIAKNQSLVGDSGYIVAGWCNKWTFAPSGFGSLRPVKTQRLHRSHYGLWHIDHHYPVRA
jgi:hypothetical protein